jgi:hypothetical protein
MASLRKRYQSRLEDNGGAPVAAVPQETAAKLPEPAADPKPIEQPTAAESDPVGEAERNALRERLREMERAGSIAQQTVNRPQYATEPQRPQQTIPEVPGPVKAWLAEHPEYLSDVVGQAELQLATLRSLRDGRSWNDDDFISVLERNLGLSQQQTQPQSNGDTERAASPKPAPVPRNGTQQRPVVQRQGAPVSAPPTREVPSMTTGRPVSDVRLTVEEAQLAKSLGISEDEYKQQKARMNRLKAQGAIQNGQ